MEDYAQAWGRLAAFFAPHEFKQTPFKAAMREMSDAVRAKEHAQATARVAKAKERIERVRKGEDAGLKAPFDPGSPAYRAAVENMGRVVRDLYLIDDDRLREIVNLEGGAEEIKADKERTARWEARRAKRSKAAQKGWSRYQQFFDEQRHWRAEQRG